MTLALDINGIEQDLRRALGDLATRKAADEYVLHMWEYALQAEHWHNEHTDSIPYVPFVPEDLGLALTEASRVLDIGCLGGYGLYDFMRCRVAQGRPVPELVGIDVTPASVVPARELAAVWAAPHPAMFARAVCEHLPFRDGSFDLLILRLVLPYVQLTPALAEVRRVLRPGGLVFFQLHSFRYYLKRCRKMWRRPVRLSYFARPLLSGLVFKLTLRQPHSRWLRQTALDTRTLTRALAPWSFSPVWEGPFREKPQIVYRDTGPPGITPDRRALTGGPRSLRQSP